MTVVTDSHGRRYCSNCWLWRDAKDGKDIVRKTPRGIMKRWRCHVCAGIVKAAAKKEKSGA
jgi:rubredoxin